MNKKFFTMANGGYVPNEAALEEIYHHARRGGTQAELADMFGISRAVFNVWISNDKSKQRPDVRAKWFQGQYEYKAQLRENQLQLSEVNAQMAVHLGKHYLGQDDKPQEVHHLHRVIGTLPDYDQTSGDWARQFAPQPVIDAGHLIEAEIEDADIEDGEDGSQ